MRGQVSTMFDQPLAEEIGLFRGLIVRSVQALSVLRDTAGKIESVGLDAGGVRRQIEQLGPRVVEQTGRFVTAIVDRTLETLNHAAQMLDSTIATQITEWSAALTASMEAFIGLRLVQSDLAASGILRGGCRQADPTADAAAWRIPRGGLPRRL